MLRFLLGFLSGVFALNLLQRFSGAFMIARLLGFAPRTFTIKIEYSGGWKVENLGAGGTNKPDKIPRVTNGDFVQWNLIATDDPVFAVIQVNKEYFDPSGGSSLSSDGLVFLANPSRNSVKSFVKLEAKKTTKRLEYSYTVLCLRPSELCSNHNGSGETSIGVIEQMLEQGNHAAFLRNEFLALAQNASPPRMIIKG